MKHTVLLQLDNNENLELTLEEVNTLRDYLNENFPEKSEGDLLNEDISSNPISWPFYDAPGAPMRPTGAPSAVIFKGSTCK